jgi:hypothetical protein
MLQCKRSFEGSELFYASDVRHAGSAYRLWTSCMSYLQSVPVSHSATVTRTHGRYRVTTADLLDATRRTRNGMRILTDSAQVPPGVCVCAFEIMNISVLNLAPSHEGAWASGNKSGNIILCTSRKCGDTRSRWGTMLEAGRSRVRDPMRWMIFFPPICLILPAALGPGFIQPLK